MYYSDEIIEEVRSRNDIVEVISGYVRLQKKGASYFGLCPFHNEKTASFSVSPAKQIFYCFGCGKGGNVFRFLMDYENETFQEALTELAERAGVTLPKDSGRGNADRSADLRRQQLLDIHKEAAIFYFHQLTGPAGKPGADYLLGRQLTKETIVRFGLGFADQTGQALYRHLKEKGYDDALLKESGLVIFDEKRGGRDRFWNRVMFPIMDVRSRVIGFGGRVMGKAEPKYLNSPESPIFDKSRNLYGLHLARHTRRSFMILCEGYMDVISMHQAGFDNAVASLGTALTQQHAALLKRYTSDIILAYDSDGAGQKAASRAIPILKEAGISVRVLNMRPHKDPDEFMKALGKDAFEERLAEADGSFMYEIDVLRGSYDFDRPEQKNAFYNAMADRLIRIPSKLERDTFISALARRYSVSEKDLNDLVILRAKTAGQGLYDHSRPAASGSDPAEPAVIEVLDPALSGGPGGRKKRDMTLERQKLLLTWMVKDPNLADRIASLIRPDDFTDDLCRQAAEMVFANRSAGKEIRPAALLNHFPEEQQSEAAGIFYAPIPDEENTRNTDKQIKEAVWQILEARRKNAPGLTERAELTKRIERLKRS